MLFFSQKDSFCDIISSPLCHTANTGKCWFLYACTLNLPPQFDFLLIPVLMKSSDRLLKVFSNQTEIHKLPNVAMRVSCFETKSIVSF